MHQSRGITLDILRDQQSVQTLCTSPWTAVGALSVQIWQLIWSSSPSCGTGHGNHTILIHRDAEFGTWVSSETQVTVWVLWPVHTDLQLNSRPKWLET